MKLISVSLSNFRSHEETFIPFGDGVTAIVGDNGAGKSSIFEGVWWCLFGQSRTRTQDELIMAGKDSVAVVVVFEHAQKTYEVHRTFVLNARGKGGVTHLTFRPLFDAGDLTKATISETEAAIAKLIGSWLVISATSYVGQGDGDRFMRSRPAERRDIFASSLAVSPDWNRWWHYAQERIAVVAKEMVKATVLIEENRKRLKEGASASSDLATARDLVNSLMHAQEVQEANADRLSQQLSDAQARVETATASARRLQEARYRAGKLNAELIQVRRQIAERRDYIAEGSALEEAMSIERKREAEFAEQMREYNERLFTPGDGKCPMCGQPVVGAVLKPTSGNASTNAARPINPFVPNRELYAKHARYQESVAAMPDLERRLGDLQMEHNASVAEAEQLSETQAPVSLTDVEALERSYKAARTQLQATLRSREDANWQLSRAVTLAKIYEQATEELAEELEELKSFKRAEAIWDCIAEACGPRGVRQLIAEQALDALEAEANRRLNRLQPGYSVRFSTLSEGGKETLEVGVETEEGMRPFESLSGGESARVAVAVRLAMSIVTANAHGLAALPSVILDEAFGAQDAAGKDAFIECLTDLSTTVGQVLVVSHDAEFQSRFETQIVLKKVNGRTEVVK